MRNNNYTINLNITLLHPNYFSDLLKMLFLWYFNKEILKIFVQEVHFKQKFTDYWFNSFFIQDEKNQLMTTNVWLWQASVLYLNTFSSNVVVTELKGLYSYFKG